MGSVIQGDIVVLGAGVAGLTAARNLARAGAKVVLVEARDRVGGRIFTHHEESLDVPIELGAEFIHGRPPALWQEILAAGLSTWELGGPDDYYEEGRLVKSAFEGGMDVLEDLKNYQGPDVSFADYLRGRNDPAEAKWITSYVEGFNAADPTVIGVASLARQQIAEDSIEGSRIFRIREGYDQLPQALLDMFLALGGILHLNTKVKAIRWQNRQVQLTCTSKGDPVEDIAARAAVITLPLGVLQRDEIRFDPPPREILFHIQRLAFGNARRITLVFDDCFWNQDNEEPLSFLFSAESLPPTWWTPAPLRAPVITGWIGGPRADDQRLDEESFLIDASVNTIGRVFSIGSGEARKRLRRAYTHNWRQDPYSRGAYSYVPAGALDAMECLSQPVQQTLFFAGEHTDFSGHWGTVHGAQSSGARVANDVARAL